MNGINRTKALVGLAVVLVGSTLTGCYSVVPPDPNAIDINSALFAKNLQQAIREMYAVLGIRVRRKEITQDEADKILKKFVSDSIKEVDPAKVDSKQAWRFGDLFRQAGRWEESYRLYKRAVEFAKGDEDRRVNDSLQLARVAAHLKKTDEALALAKSTFDVAPAGKAPILMSILYEITPELKGKGKDLELAQLLEQAIQQHSETQVDPESDAGRAFIAVRPHHIQNAWVEVMRLYESAKRPDLARKALAESEKSSGKYANL